MSHVIRTPLATKGGFVDLLTRAGGPTPPQRRYLELARAANAALLTIVNDILDFAKIGGGQIDLGPHPRIETEADFADFPHVAAK